MNESVPATLRTRQHDIPDGERHRRAAKATISNKSAQQPKRAVGKVAVSCNGKAYGAARTDRARAKLQCTDTRLQTEAAAVAARSRGAGQNGHDTERRSGEKRAPAEGTRTHTRQTTTEESANGGVSCEH